MKASWVPVLLGIICAILVLTVLYFADAVVAPVAAALFIIAIVWPLQKRLQTRLPQLLALAIVVMVVLLVFIVFASVVAWGFGRIGRSLIAETPRLQGLYELATAWLETHGIAVAGLWAEHFNMRWIVAAIQGLSARLNTMISFWIVVLVYVLLGLLEIGPLARKIPSIISREAARVLIIGGERTAIKLRRYVMIRAIMSVATGSLVYIFALALGLQLAAEWGVIAFTLNFIPFVGPFIATLLPTFYALAQFESLYSALFVFACLNLIQFAIGSYVEPRVAGNALALSPFLVLFSVFLWMFLWGLFGAFIGVPIAIALLTFFAQAPATKWVAQLLGAPDDEVEDVVSVLWNGRE
ncbi:AI-2E family transporter [Mesorhizobium sp. DCY119]|uniref:AI-2E family transporter n=1 Tax=Mesorhizobium sp. DCY119 TaxID=2108445 RepID=UPI000E714FDC|nr:AI-2E family transporter [Mesorhizobium sp. DCY119]RJG40694.1 AI-2E family transporter [Mesorhizobium sp. DCY119]